MTVLLGIIGLTLALRPGRDTRGRTLCAAAVVATPWLGIAGALLFPDTATYDPEFADRTLFVFGLHGQIVLALILLTALLGAVVASWQHADSTRSGGHKCAPARYVPASLVPVGVSACSLPFHQYAPSRSAQKVLGNLTG